MNDSVTFFGKAYELDASDLGDGPSIDSSGDRSGYYDQNNNWVYQYDATYSMGGPASDSVCTDAVYDTPPRSSHPPRARPARGV